MRTMNACLFGGALLSAGLASKAQAGGAVPDFTFGGALEVLSIESVDGPYSGYATSYTFINGTTTVDVFDFSISESSSVTFDALSWAQFPTWVDTMLFVFDDDGMPLTQDNFIAYNDDFDGYDYGRGYDYVPDFNGSVSTLDSFFTLMMGPGDYTLAVASYFTDVSDIANGLSSPEGYIATSEEIEARGDGFVFSGEYLVDVFVDPIPVPSSMAMLGVAGLLATKRRRA